MGSTDNTVGNSLAVLRDLADTIGEDDPRLMYVIRVEVERALFLTVHDLARDYYGYQIRGFSYSVLEAVERQASVSDADRAVFDAIRFGFELKSALANLAAGDPYVEWERLGPSLPGRSNAIRALAGGLKQFIARVSDLR